MMMHSYIAAVLAAGAGLVAADQINLINCSGAAPSFSLEAYYPDGATANYDPNENDLCYPVGDQNEVVWEDGTSCTFSSGVTFTTDLELAATEFAPYTYAGTASNGYNSYNCYRDDGHTIFTLGEGSIYCDSIYYCLED
ncbi:hypothetical protein TsFJ059_000001 [Trichoderma semiorbis]|uniref:Uncharacterized protein n=1 Tax=Trichoderma semiorbis TaxID=1491008 RepID=A0A9P8KXU1_9HYPO|nr:hypothetical protein TsFJ059_000001 [Trichoderma semiorbis]